MVKKLKSTKKDSMYEKKLFGLRLKMKERFIKDKLMMLTCSNFTLKKAVLVSLLFLDEV